ncbi:MAG: hypothetical protein ACE5D8_01230 [Fidelibacterota bacterium]
MNSLLMRNLRRSGLMCFFVFISIVHGATTTSLTSSFITPRLHLWSADEDLQWRSVLQFHADPTRHIAIQSLLEVGSTNLLLTKSFRMYQLSIRYQNNTHSIALGRQGYWSRMNNLRFDGLTYALKTRRLGRFTFLSGLEAIYELTRDSASPDPVVLVSWTAGNRFRNLQASYWTQSLGGESHSFTGLAWTYPIFGIQISQQISYDQESERIHNFRFSLQYNLNNHLLQLGLKQRRYMVGELFHWSEEGITIPPTFYFQTRSRFGRKLAVVNQYSYRFQNEPSTYLHSAAVYKDYSLGLLVGSQGRRTWYGGNVGLTRTIHRKIRVGLNYETNILVLVDEWFENANSYGIYGWLEWNPMRNIAFRSYFRMASNPYFIQDGRGGVTIHVAL